MSDFRLDLTEFRQAIREVLVDSRKTEAEILNRAGLVAIIGGKGVKGAIQRTPKADKGKINALTPAQLAGAVKRKNPGRNMTRKEWNAAIKKEKARRRRSISYTAGPGWHKAAVAMGGRGVRGLQPGFAQSEAVQGYGEKATPNHLEAEIANTAPAADLIGRQALQAAINDTARDMVQHARDRLQRVFDRRNAR